jgi:hypothetical protein
MATGAVQVVLLPAVIDLLRDSVQWRTVVLVPERCGCLRTWGRRRRSGLRWLRGLGIGRSGGGRGRWWRAVGRGHCIGTGLGSCRSRSLCSFSRSGPGGNFRRGVSPRGASVRPRHCGVRQGRGRGITGLSRWGGAPAGVGHGLGSIGRRCAGPLLPATAEQSRHEEQASRKAKQAQPSHVQVPFRGKSIPVSDPRLSLTVEC